ncbi:MAG: hypothetical protein PHQ27_05145 [Victivallales bacterium]|nr:hypothetical protein [Victivallales bacterium]
MKNWRRVVLLLLLFSGISGRGREGELQYRSDDGTTAEASSAFRKMLRFRCGEIIAAGISRHDVPIADSEQLLSLPPSSPAYAVIRVRLDEGRSLSIHDFSLIHNYKNFACVAIRPVPGKFDAARRIFPAFNGRVYDLLFIPDIPDFNPKITYRCTLHYCLASTGMTDTDVRFRNFDGREIVFPGPEKR